MTTATWSAAPDSSSDANFRAWGGGISDALAAIGLVQTADTGQIDWTTVAKPPSGNNYQGYEIWRMDDTEQSSCPVFFRLDYGAGTSATRPSIKATWGTGSNGSGTITGSPLLTVATASANSNSATLVNGCASAQDGYFWLSWGGDNGAGGICHFPIGFFRFCDDTGTPNDDGGVLGYAINLSSSTPLYRLYYRPTSTVLATEGIACVPIATNLTSGAYGTDTAIYELMSWSDGPTRLRGGVVGMSADFTPGSNFSMTSLGSTRTFRPLNGNSYGWRGADMASSTYTVLCGEWG